MRTKRLVGNVLANGGARAVNLLVTLAMVPLTLNALEPRDYGYYAMALSFSVLASYADLGLGLAVVNAIAQQAARPASSKAAHAVSVTWYLLLGIAAVGLVVTLVAKITFDALLGSDSGRDAALLAVACVLAGLPTGLPQRMLFALERNVEANAWATGARLASLAGVALVISQGWARLDTLILATLGIPALAGWASVFIVFHDKRLAALRPRVIAFRRRVAPVAVTLGVSFLALQLVPFIETSVDVILIGRFLGVDAVAAYDVNARLFGYVPALVSLAAYPLWPAVASARAASDQAWISRIETTGFAVLAVVASLAAGLLAAFGDEVVMRWVGRVLTVGGVDRALFCTLSVLFSLALFQSMLMNGRGQIRAQVRFSAAYLPILLAGKAIAVWAGGITGLLGVTAAGAAARLVILGRGRLSGTQTAGRPQTGRRDEA